MSKIGEVFEFWRETAYAVQLIDRVEEQKILAVLLVSPFKLFGNS